jgi:cell division transport system permease protein
MRPGFFVREALRGLRRSSAPALAALLTVLLTALVLGVFIPIVQATTGTANEVRSRVAVDVYVNESATQREQEELRSALEATANVKSVEFISKGEALARAQEKNPRAFREGAELLGSNPLPASFRVRPEDPDRIDEIVQRLQPNGQPQLAAIDEVRPRGGHRQDPLRHRTGEGADRGPRRAARARLDRADRQHDPAVDLRPPA